MKRIALIIVAVMMASMMMAQDKVAKTPSGYHGFLEQGSYFRLSDDMNTTVGVSTTHGFYFNSNTFVGVGMGVEGGNGFFAVPFFTAVKYNFNHNKMVSPTAQLRLGSYLGDKSGTYADMAIGLRFASSRNFAINVMLTGSLLTNGLKEVEVWNDKYGWFDYGEEIIQPSGLGLRVGIEW